MNIKKPFLRNFPITPRGRGQDVQASACTGPWPDLMSAFSGGCDASRVHWRRLIFGDTWHWAPIWLLHVAVTPLCKLGGLVPSCLEDHTRPCHNAWPGHQHEMVPGTCNDHPRVRLPAMGHRQPHARAFLFVEHGHVQSFRAEFVLSDHLTAHI